MNLLTSYSSLTTILLLPTLLILLTLLTTVIFTTLRYHLIRLTTSQESRKPQPPTYLPYTLPFLGHALSFLNLRPGAFWADLLTNRISRTAGSVTLLLGGRVTHVIFSPFAVQAMFKARNVTRHPFNVQVVTNGFGASDEDCKKFYNDDMKKKSMRHVNEGGKTDGEAESEDPTQEELNSQYLLTQSAVNELTTKFVEILRDDFAAESTQWKEIKLYDWLKRLMFKASTVAFLGSLILETYPDLAEDFFPFDAEFLRMFFGLPKFIAPLGFNKRDKLLEGMSRWLKQGWEEYRANGASGPDPATNGWDPIFGSRVVQAREQLMSRIDLSMRGRASLHLGFLFGLASNAIPSTGWMLFHILSPVADSSLLPRVLAEVRSAQLPDGTLDIPTLISLPLLQSIFQETLRMYVDVLVTREVVDSDLILPVNASGSKQVLLKKNSIVMAPSWLGHRDASAWGDSPPFDVFFPERFLKLDEKTGKETFSIGGTGGKLFPFGGGRNICPGRVFAKQEVLASVAMVLLGFELEVEGFVDEAGREMKKFPGLRKTYTGNGVMAMDGDFNTRIRRRV